MMFNNSCNCRREHDIIMPMIRNSAHYNLILQNTSLKLPQAILSTDRNRQQATGNRQQATGNRQLYSLSN